MNVFLRPLIDSLNDLLDNGTYFAYQLRLAFISSLCFVVLLGVNVSTADGVKHIKATMVVLSCDLPARAQVLNMKQFNGEHGCHLCEEPGKARPNLPMQRWWPYNSNIKSPEELFGSNPSTRNS